jgi:putative transposase
VADIIYVPTWAGTVYVAIVIDAIGRRILGWRAATMRTELVLDALEMAIWTKARGGVEDLAGLVHHTDAGSQTSIRFTQRLAEADAAPSVGSVGDAYDNALAETEIGLFKTELINSTAPGAPTMTSRSPPSSGSTGSTTADCTPPAQTSPPQKQIHYRRHPALAETLVSTP